MYPLTALGFLLVGGMLLFSPRKVPLRVLGAGLILLGCGMLWAVISGRVVLPLG